MENYENANSDFKQDAIDVIALDSCHYKAKLLTLAVLSARLFVDAKWHSILSLNPPLSPQQHKHNKHFWWDGGSPWHAYVILEDSLNYWVYNLNMAEPGTSPAIIGSSPPKNIWKAFFWLHLLYRRWEKKALKWSDYGKSWSWHLQQLKKIVCL